MDSKKDLDLDWELKVPGPVESDKSSVNNEE